MLNSFLFFFLILFIFCFAFLGFVLVFFFSFLFSLSGAHKPRVYPSATPSYDNSASQRFDHRLLSLAALFTHYLPIFPIVLDRAAICSSDLIFGILLHLIIRELD